MSVLIHTVLVVAWVGCFPAFLLVAWIDERNHREPERSPGDALNRIWETDQ